MVKRSFGPTITKIFSPVFPSLLSYLFLRLDPFLPDE